VVSIIIPIYNEEKILLENSSRFKTLSQQSELIFVDGGSNDRGVELAKSYAKVLSCKKGRAKQMNCGARFAKEDVLLFLHADTVIFPNTVASIKEKVMGNGFIGGCLTQRIDRSGIEYRLIEGFGNIRARITRIFYGDQGIFVNKDAFFKMGGFPEVPMMEDAIFTKRLRKLGKTFVLPDKILVSPRRWEARGLIRTIFLYLFLNILFWLRVSLDRLKRFYEDLR
jgi:rSAM/selenodomain-associated transferase 2